MDDAGSALLLKQLIALGFESRLEEDAAVRTIRLDRPCNQGSNGVFRHIIQLSDGEMLRLVEKRSTSSREAYFYTCIYPKIRDSLPSLTPKLLGVGHQDSGTMHLFVEAGLRVSHGYSLSMADRVAELMSWVARFPPDNLKKLHGSSDLPKNSKILDYCYAARGLSAEFQLGENLIGEMEARRETITNVVSQLGFCVQHGDFYWDNMVVLHKHGMDRVMLIDWGNLAIRRVGFDIHNFLSFDDAGSIENIDFVRTIAERFLQKSGMPGTPEALIVSGTVSRMNWALSHFLRSGREKFASTFCRSFKAVLRAC